MNLDFSNLQSALTPVRESVELASSELGKSDDLVYRQFRAAGIQNFSIAWELSIRYLRRGLESFLSPSVLDSYNYRELLRVGAEHGLIQDPNAWFDFRTMRNKTAHMDDAETAQEVFEIIPAFLQQAEYLYEHLCKQCN